MKRIALFLAILMFVFGCEGCSKETPKFEKAQVERLLPQDAKATTTITDGDTVAQLASYFPGLAQGKESSIAGGWKAGYIVTFKPVQGNPVKVHVHPEGKTWSEGKGDWKAKPGLKEYLDKSLEKAEK